MRMNSLYLLDLGTTRNLEEAGGRRRLEELEGQKRKQKDFLFLIALLFLYRSLYLIAKMCARDLTIESDKGSSKKKCSIGILKLSRLPGIKRISAMEY